MRECFDSFVHFIGMVVQSGRLRYCVLKFYQRGIASVIKLVYCITKKAGLTDEEFFRYWKDIHGRIGAQIGRRLRH